LTIGRKQTMPRAETVQVHLDDTPYRPPVENALPPVWSERLLALPVYESKATDAERMQSRVTMRGQLADIMGVPAHATLGVNCPDCGKRIALVLAYRCAYCGVWFCHTCAQVHFGMRSDDRANATLTGPKQPGKGSP